jgi:nitrogenase subunit NifH
MPITTYAPDSNGAQDYEALAKEIIAQEKKHLKGAA